MTIFGTVIMRQTKDFEELLNQAAMCCRYFLGLLRMSELLFSVVVSCTNQWPPWWKRLITSPTYEKCRFCPGLGLNLSQITDTSLEIANPVGDF